MISWYEVPLQKAKGEEPGIKDVPLRRGTVPTPVGTRGRTSQPKRDKKGIPGTTRFAYKAST